MNMPRRFWQGPPQQPDNEIMKRASSIELRLWHDENHGIVGNIEIHCSIGDVFDDKYRPQEEIDREQTDALGFIRRVLGAFERKSDGDGAEACQ